MGKVDQGFLALWAARHVFGGPLSYLGFGGSGKQVRDVLHVRDLYELMLRQIGAVRRGACSLHNVGDGPSNALSLAELTALCRDRSGADLLIGSRAASHPADIPWYVTDNRKVTAATGWKPTTSAPALLDETFDWLKRHRAQLEPIFSPER